MASSSTTNATNNNSKSSSSAARSSSTTTTTTSTQKPPTISLIHAPNPPLQQHLYLSHHDSLYRITTSHQTPSPQMNIRDMIRKDLMYRRQREQQQDVENGATNGSSSAAAATANGGAANADEKGSSTATMDHALSEGQNTSSRHHSNASQKIHSISSIIVIPAPKDLFEKEALLEYQREKQQQQQDISSPSQQGNSSPPSDFNSNNTEQSPHPPSSIPHQLIGVYPLVAFILNSNRIGIYSMHSLTMIHEITLQEGIEELQANASVLVVRTKKFIYWFPHLSDEYLARFHLYPDINCFSLSDRWLAYSTNVPIRHDQMDLSNYQKTLTKLSQNIAQLTTSGIKYLSDSIIQHTTGGGGASASKRDVVTTAGGASAPHSSSASTSRTAYSARSRSSGTGASPSGSMSPSSTLHTNHQPLKHAGTVEIRDIHSKKVIAHFRAHKNPICAIQFDPSGSLLVTASTKGTDLNVFRVAPSASGKISSRNIVHLYTLERGITSARITSISFSTNSKWIAVGSNHGTSHLFAINPHGGIVNTKTHCRLVSDQLNNSARKEYQRQQPQHLYCSPICRIRSDEISREAHNEAVKVSFYSFSASSRGSASNATPREQLYIMCPNGYVGLFSLTPRATRTDSSSSSGKSTPPGGNGQTGHGSESAGEVRELLSVDSRRMDTWFLEPVRSNIPVEWEDQVGKHRAALLREKLEAQDNDFMPTGDSSSDPLSGEQTSSQQVNQEDEEGEWISNLEIETYNQQERAWISGQIRFVELKEPIRRENLTDPNLDGEVINARLVQLNTPSRPLNWNEYKLNFKPNTIVTAVDESSYRSTPKREELDSSLRPIKRPPSRGTIYENRQESENVEDYFPVMEESLVMEGDGGNASRISVESGHEIVSEEEEDDAANDPRREEDGGGRQRDEDSSKQSSQQTTPASSGSSHPHGNDLPHSDSQSSMKFIDFASHDEDSPMRDDLDESFSSLQFEKEKRSNEA